MGDRVNESVDDVEDVGVTDGVDDGVDESEVVDDGVGDCEGAMHDTSVTLPGAPAVPPAPPPVTAKPLNDTGKSELT